LPRDDPGAGLSVVFIGHATVLIRLGRTLVLTDPNLGGPILGVPRITPAAVRSPRVPLILLSHLHPDHLDRGTFRALPADAEVIFPPDGGSYLGLIRQRRKEAAELWKPLHRAGSFSRRPRARACRGACSRCIPESAGSSPTEERRLG
jgi:L-ascorbate metabolism protein UlaG (beta-lactamase superfamily)